MIMMIYLVFMMIVVSCSRNKTLGMPVPLVRASFPNIYWVEVLSDRFEGI